MPVYNVERFVAEAVDSVLKQTYDHFEFIIINDGSTDNSSQIIRQFDDRRIILLKRKRCSRSGSLPRNDGLRIARGDLIALMDADDICIPHRFERQVAFLEKNRQVDILGSRMKYIDMTGNLIEGDPYPPIWNGDPKEYRRWLVHDRNVMPNPVTTFRRQVLDSVPCYKNYACAGDYDFWLRASRYFNLYNMDDFLLYRRKHPNSVGCRFDHLRRRYHEQSLREERNWLRSEVKKRIASPDQSREYSHELQEQLTWVEKTISTFEQRVVFRDRSLRGKGPDSGTR